MKPPIIAITVLMLAASLPVAGASHHFKLQGRGLASYDRHTGRFVTAARNVPRGSILSVTGNGRTIQVLVNDSGPYVSGRVLDLSTGAFRALFGGLGQGVGRVSYHVIKLAHKKQKGEQ